MEENGKTHVLLACKFEFLSGLSLILIMLLREPCLSFSEKKMRGWAVFLRTGCDQLSYFFRIPTIGDHEVTLWEGSLISTSDGCDS